MYQCRKVMVNNSLIQPRGLSLVIAGVFHFQTAGPGVLHLYVRCTPNSALTECRRFRSFSISPNRFPTEFGAVVAPVGSVYPFLTMGGEGNLGLALTGGSGHGV